MVQNIIKWKLRYFKQGHTCSFRDVANAFPSTAHEHLDEMIRDAADPNDQALLQLRYSQATMTITTPAGEQVTIQPQVGGLQGDSAMAPMFSGMYDQKMDK